MRKHGCLGNRLSVGEKEKILRLVAAGKRHQEIANEMVISLRTIHRIMSASGGLGQRRVCRSSLRLSVAEREEISRGLEAELSFRAIGRLISRAPSTVSREVLANGGREGYRGWKADNRARKHAMRAQPTKLERNPRLQRIVEAKLKKSWSPMQISRRLMVDFPNDDDMRISHETIYRALYLQGRGGLKRELTRYLRTQRPKRQPQGRKSHINSGKLRDMVNISERPPEVADGAIPGHWEGDLLCGKKNRSAVATLVERQTRFTQLVALGQNRSADYLAQALARQIQLLPTHLWRSLTWDQGREMGSHTKFTISTGVDVYFCDPRSPWQRGTNENTNGLLRQYLPKGTDLSKVSQAQLDKIAEELNGRPRQTLNWRTPSEMLITLLR